jgi:hypothetical protein
MRIRIDLMNSARKIKKINDFRLWFQKESLIFASASKDSLIVLNVSVNQLSPLQVFGQKFIDIEMLTGQKLTLMVSFFVANDC